MEIIKKNINTWIDIFKKINVLKDQYGYGIVKETKIYLENVSKKSKLNNKELLYVFWGYGITNPKYILSLLNVIDSAYRYDTIIKDLEDYYVIFGINSVAFMINMIDRPIHINLNNKNIYLAKDVIPYRIDNTLVFKDNRPFIVEDTERTIYTSDFNLKCETLAFYENIGITR